MRRPLLSTDIMVSPRTKNIQFSVTLDGRFKVNLRFTKVVGSLIS